MLTKMFLKLDGVQGESKSPRHFGEIELSAVQWGVQHHNQFGAGMGPGNAMINDLIVSKQLDKTSPILWLACTSGQNFAEGVLTIEISESGGLLNSVIFKMMSILVYSVISENSPVIGARGVVETVRLNCENLELMRH